MCSKNKVVIGLIGAAVVVYLVAPGSVGASLPVLLLAICPLSMILMMKAMTSVKTEAPTSSAGPGLNDSGDEISRLRAEVAELRAATPRQSSSPLDPQMAGE